ncbi:hypothetical protein L6R52_36295, partial [Myxococcota bacterium]|nr:hypothetical protein [Myxococcota bacterium]
MGVRETDGPNKRGGARPAQPTRSPGPDAELATEVTELDRSFLDDIDEPTSDDDRPVVVPSALEEDAPTDRGRAVRPPPEPKRPEVRPVSARAIVERSAAPEPATSEPSRRGSLTLPEATEPPKRTLRLPPVGGGARSGRDLDRDAEPGASGSLGALERGAGNDWGAEPGPFARAAGDPSDAAPRARRA